MSNTITIELCAEDRARIDRLTDALERLTVAPSAPVVSMPDLEVHDALTEVLAKVTPTTTKNEPTEPKPTEPSVTPTEEETTPTVEETVPTAKPVKASELSQKVVTLIQAGKRAEVTEIIHAYAPNVSKISPEHYADVYAKLVELEKLVEAEKQEG